MTLKDDIEEIRAILARMEAYATPPDPVQETIRVRVGENLKGAFTRAITDGANLALDPGIHDIDGLYVPPGLTKSIVISTWNDMIPGPLRREDWEHLAIIRSSGHTITYDHASTGVNLSELGLMPSAQKRPIVFGSDTMRTPDMMPRSVVHKNLLVLDSTDGLGPGIRGIMAGCDGYSLTHSTILDVRESKRNTQAISVWNGGRGIFIEDNVLEGAGENIMFGGGDALTPEMIPSDIVIRGNTIRKPEAWKSVLPAPTIKCLFEIKNVKRLRVAENIFENNWPSVDWAQAVAVVLKCANQSGREPWTTVEDLVFENNIVRNVGMLMSIISNGDDKRVTEQMKNVIIRNNLVYNMNTPDWPGYGQAFALSNVPDGLTIAHNTIIGNSHSFLYFWYDVMKMNPGRLVVQDNVAYHGAYGVKGQNSDGINALHNEIGTTNCTFDGNVLAKHPARTNRFPTNNKVIPMTDFLGSLSPTMEVIPSSPIALAVNPTDGQMPGCNIGNLPKGGHV